MNKIFEEYPDITDKVCAEVAMELLRAKGLFPDYFHNQHEGYAVILEEVDELWQEIKKNQHNYDLPAQRKEAIQAAAMLVRFVVELIDEKLGGRSEPARKEDTEPKYRFEGYRKIIEGEPGFKEKEEAQPLKLTEAEMVIIQERRRQIEKEGFTKEHDAGHTNGELAAAAGCYALAYWSRTDAERLWPFEKEWFKSVYEGYVYTSDRINNLKKAGALIIAEIERLMPTKEVSEPASGEDKYQEIYDYMGITQPSDVAQGEDELAQRLERLSIYNGALEKEIADLKEQLAITESDREQFRKWAKEIADQCDEARKELAELKIGQIMNRNKVDK